MDILIKYSLFIQLKEIKNFDKVYENKQLIYGKILFKNFPNEILLNIFNFLNQDELFKMFNVCTFFSKTVINYLEKIIKNGF